MFRNYTIVVLSILAFVQFSAYSSMKRQRDKVENTMKAKYEKQVFKQLERYQIALEDANKKAFMASHELEIERKNIKVKFRDIKHENQKVITEYIYTDCKLTDGGLRNAKQARIAANTRKFIN